MKKRFSISRFTAAGLCVCLAYVLACCIMTGGYNRKQLLQSGKVFSFSERMLSQKGDGLHYDKTRRCMQITKGEAIIQLNEMNAAKVWNYLFVELGTCSDDFIQVRVDCYNKEGAVSGTVWAQLQAGDNYITLNGSQAVKAIAVRLQNAEGVEFSLKKIQLRMKLPVSMKKIAWITFLLSFLFCWGTFWLAHSTGAKFVWNSFDRYLLQSVKDVCEYIYRELGNHLYLNVREEDREKVRIFLFALLFFLQCAALNSKIFAKAEYYRYFVLVFCIILFLIALLLIEERETDKKRDRERSWIWTVFWLGTCISDILVGKYYIYPGWIMLTVVEFFLYWHQQMKYPDCLLRNMMSGLRLSFFPVFVWCFIFQQSMIFYAVLMFLVFGFHFIRGKKWQDGAGLLLSAYLIYAGAVRSLAGDSFVITQSLYDQRVIWSEFLRKLNCGGHPERVLNLWGQEWYPGNGILEIAYRYGIFTGVLYIGLVCQSGKMVMARCKQVRKNNEICFFFISVSAVFLIANLFFNLEEPFLSPVWTLFYLLLGMGTEKQTFSD